MRLAALKREEDALQREKERLEAEKERHFRCAPCHRRRAGICLTPVLENPCLQSAVIALESLQRAGYLSESCGSKSAAEAALATAGS